MVKVIVDEHTLAELRLLDFGNWKSEQFTGEKILTLTELLSLVETHDLVLIWKLKSIANTKRLM